MAAIRNKVPVGSAQWIKDEREQVAQFRDQEAEDFAFSARNELEWLNEHMAEIFSNNGVNVTEIFKTPGKLRGKTPRTIRKRNPLETRAPLTDIFSATILSKVSPSRGQRLFESPPKSPVIERHVPAELESQEISQANGKGDYDSGYHGMSGDKMDLDGIARSTATTNAWPTIAEPMLIDPPVTQENETRQPSEERETTEGSFHSAREDVTMRDATKGATTEPVQHPLKVQEEEPPKERSNSPEPQKVADHIIAQALPSLASPEAVPQVIENEDRESLLDEDPELAPSHTPSDGSSPPKPMVRKSSLTFASLPAREPLTTKKSIGARVSRTSHLDQTKSAMVGRGSYFGRYTGGKSLGNARQPEYVDETEEEDAMDLDEEEKPQLTREESDGDGKMAKLHNKSSTQRLHDRINMLGQTQPARPNESIPGVIPVASQPSYPDLPKPNLEGLRVREQSVVHDTGNGAALTNEDDNDDWIKPPAAQADPSNRPQLAKNRVVDVMEQIRGKDRTDGDEIGVGPHEREDQRPASPLRPTDTTIYPTANSGHKKSVSTTVLTSPTKPLTQQEMKYHKKAVSVSIPSMQSVISTTPAGNPVVKAHQDGPLSASKSKLQSIMKSARGLFTSSAGISAQAKLETLSPSSRTRSKVQATINGVPANMSNLSHTLYPNLPDTTHNAATIDQAMTSEGRKTRISAEKEQGVKSNEVNQRQNIELELERERTQDLQKGASKQEIHTALIATKNVLEMGTEAGLQKAASKPTRQSPRQLQKTSEAQRLSETHEVSVMAVQANEMSELMGAPPPRTQIHPSQMQKPKELRRPLKPAKEPMAKPKPQPVAIRVGTLSQRIPLTNAALSSSLQESLPPTQAKQPTLTKKPSTASLQTSISTTSLKSSVSSVPTKPKALIAAERKREQDEREAMRKAEHKREIERKRIAQQEEVQRREQQQRQEAERQRDRERSIATEDPNKAAKKQAIEKRRLELLKKEQQRNPQRPVNDLVHALQQEKMQAPGPSHRGELGGGRPPSKINSIQDFPKPPINHLAPNPAKPPLKRVFEPEHDDELLGPARGQGGQVFQQYDAKRRRTNDEEVHEAPIRPTMEPPIRQSNIHKNAPKSSLFANHYTTAPPPPNTHHPAQSLLKASTINQAYQQHPYHNQTARSAHPMNTAQFRDGKIPFAEAPNPPQASHKTPLPSKSAMVGVMKSSPLFNTDNIHLEEPATDSEDEDSDEERKKKQKQPDWVLTPVLTRTLIDQDNVDTDALFGPPQPPNMEDMFKDKSRHHRFRSRTSSANWGGQDRLTEEDIRADHAARERMRRDGGWTYGL